MHIGEAARRSGLPSKTIRYYEEIDLISPARGDNGYRDYSSADVHKLQFVQRTRGLGFSVEDCRTLLSLWEDERRASAEVKALASSHLSEIERKVEELKSLHKTLKHLVENCHGDDRPDCPIIDGLAGDTGRT